MSSEKRRNRRRGVPTHPAALRLPVERLRRLDELVTVAQFFAMVIAFFGSDPVRGVVALGCIAVFLAGAALFAWAFLIAAGRSRREQVTVVGAFFLGEESIGKDDRRWAYRLLFVQSVIGLVAAAADPYTAMAFGVLVPMWGLGVVAFLGSAHGVFASRDSTK